jgi:hypothetical protein
MGHARSTRRVARYKSVMVAGFPGRDASRKKGKRKRKNSCRPTLSFSLSGSSLGTSLALVRKDGRKINWRSAVRQTAETSGGPRI